MKYNPYTDNLNIKVFDIETTGLNPQTDMIISASFCDEDGDGLVQFFCEDPNAEFLLITKILDELTALDGVITYNGIRFDLPFVLTRAKKYGIEDDVPDIKNYDIYKLLKSYWAAGKLMLSLSQKSVEHAMGIDIARTDKIDGAECINLYNNYIKTGQESVKETILLHNADDVRQLSKISGKLSFLPFHQIAFETGFSVKQRLSYPGAEDVLINIDPIIETNHGIIATGHAYLSKIDDFAIYDNCISLVSDSYSGLVRIELTLNETEDYEYIDLENLPVDITVFSELEGFVKNFLIIKYKDKINYRETDLLISELLRRIIE